VDHAGRHTAAQVRGVVLARALAEGRPVAHELPSREGRVVTQRRELRVFIADLRRRLLNLTEWADPAIDAALPDGLRVLATLDQLAEAGEPVSGDAAELDAFLARLPAAVRAWRGAW
jgi:type IV secretory pathway ATPase VirB11/archaellum biosynthesis ATPase